MNKKINISYLIIGIASIIAFIILVKFTYTSRYIRINGELKYCPIVSIDYGVKNYVTVSIDSQELDARLMIDDLCIGDSIAVRYIKGESRVIQERVELWRFYLWFGLESTLLIAGVISIVGGFMGKGTYRDYAHRYKRSKKAIKSTKKKKKKKKRK